MNDRFRVVHFQDACQNGWHEDCCNCRESWDFYYELYDTKVTVDGKPKFIGSDRAEPEDKLLVRDFRWVLEAMNRLAEGKDP
jgi:hypothetical protein